MDKVNAELNREQVVRIERQQENLGKLDGKVSDEISHLTSEINSHELSRIDRALEDIKSRTYNGHIIYIDGPIGGINFKVQQIIFDKLHNNEELTQFEKDI